jgi:hypothetical protein
LKDVFQVKGLSKWVDLLIILGMAVLYRALFIVVVKLKEKLSPIIKNAFFTHEYATASKAQEDDDSVITVTL